MEQFGVSNVTFGYANKPLIFEDFTWSVQAGSIVCLTGRNGTGKTTLLHLASGIVPGEFTGLPTARDEASSGPHYVLQTGIDTLLPWATVLANISLPLRIRGLSRKDSDERAKAMVGTHGPLSSLRTFLSEYPYRLSGGYQQLVLLARAFLSESPVIVLDEPFAGLDGPNRRHVRDVILSHRQNEHRVTFVIVTHQIDDAVLISDRIDVLPATWPIRTFRGLEIGEPHPRRLAASQVARVLEQVRVELED